VFDKGDHERTVEHWQHRIGAYVDTDLALVGTVGGVYGRKGPEAAWKKLIDCRSKGDTWWGDFGIARQKSVLFYPSKFWRLPGTDSFLVWDEYMIAPYSMSIENGQVRVMYLEEFDEALGKVYVSYVSAFEDQFFVSTVALDDTMIVCTLPMDLSVRRNLYRCPLELSRRIDTIGFSNVECYSVFNPVDSTIWIAFYAYAYLYVVDMKGQLLDSILISAPDFRLPAPPRSRMKSKAVAREWLSSFTPFSSLTYAPSGFVVFQYRSGWERLAADSIPLFSTITWAADRMPVELDVETHRQVAGVMPDGRVIFGEYLVENEKCVGLVLTEARIEP
jgi:hypothetical protein